MSYFTQDHEGKWTWADGSSVSMSTWSWASGQPNNGKTGIGNNRNKNQDCVAIIFNDKEKRGAWDDVKCEVKFKFACQIVI